MRFIALVLGLIWAASSDALAQLNDARLDDYNQWKLALESGAVASPVSIAAPPGFAVEIVRTARPGEGSWIALAFDPKGRIVVSREDRGLLRFTLADERGGGTKVESINGDLLECRGLLFAHDALYVAANNSLGLYRLKDTDGDDSLDEVKLLRRIEGGVGHGRNNLALGPDGMIYLTCGNNVRVPPETSALSPHRNPGQDRLLPCVWNEFLFDSDARPPCGHVARTDAEGKTWELVAGGFRNPYGLAFNPEGDLFAYDADMEWDAGAPWYRPTCVMHVVPGGEYGWRQETTLWPDFYADALPRVADIGLGSPTGVVFGTNSNFPPEFQRAFFICDWAYGRIIAVHLTAKGSSYVGRAETFIKGKPLNLTGIAIGPDGAMYFTVGGRGTQSALYRVRYTGGASKETSPADVAPKAVAALRQRRRQLEKLMVTPTSDGLDLAWSNLDSIDPFIRAAARVAIENHPPHDIERFASPRESTLRRAMELLTLVRVAEPNQRDEVLAKLFELLNSRTFVENERLIALRTLQLAFIRLGPPNQRDHKRLLAKLESFYPAEKYAENHLLCELLVYLKSPLVMEKSLALLETARSQEEKLFYIHTLRNIASGWTLDQRRTYLAWVKRMETFEGSNYFSRFLTFIRSDVLASLSDQEKQELAPLIETLGKSDETPYASVVNRPSVRDWQLEEILAALDKAKEQPRNLARGEEMFSAALCIRCHRMNGKGSAIGPDLTGVSARYSRKDLLDAIVNPSRIIDEKYRDTRILTADGEMFVGQLAGGDAEHLYLAANPLAPAQVVRLRRDAIEARQPSLVSPMPTGLLNTLSEEEILDLVAWLENGGSK